MMRAREASKSTAGTAPISRAQFVARMCALGGACALGDGLSEPNEPQITLRRAAIPGLRAPIRMVQIADMHRSALVSEGYLDGLTAAAMGLRPDLVALTGDFITNSSTFLPSCLSTLTKLRPTLGMFAVLGNHDYKADDRTAAPIVTAGLESIGVHVLMNRSVQLDNGLWMVGIDDWTEGTPRPAAAFRGVPLPGPVVAMTHNPFLFLNLRRYDCLTIAGHTHGGQINLPIVSRYIIGNERMRYRSGWYHDAGFPGRLYVCRGLGVVGIPLRFRARPELTVFDLVPGGAA